MDVQTSSLGTYQTVRGGGCNRVDLQIFRLTANSPVGSRVPLVPMCSMHRIKVVTFNWILVVRFIHWADPAVHFICQLSGHTTRLVADRCH